MLYLYLFMISSGVIYVGAVLYFLYGSLKLCNVYEVEFLNGKHNKNVLI